MAISRAKALAALADAGAHAVLTGHVHDPFDVPYQRGDWTVRLIGAGTLSKRTRNSPPAFNEIRIADGRFEAFEVEEGSDLTWEGDLVNPPRAGWSAGP